MTKILVAEERFSSEAEAILQSVGDVVRGEAHLPEADALLIALETRVTPELLGRAGKLRVIATRTSQLRHIDLDEAQRRGIAVLAIEPDAPALQQTPSTAEEAMALLLALIRRIPWAFDSLKDGRWERFRYGGHELAGKTLGLIGYGRLGRKVARYARAFEMSVVAYDPYVDVGGDAMPIGLEALLQTADFISLHCTWSEETRGLIGEGELRLVKPTALLVNTARGEITDERALLSALEEGRLAGAGIDTLAGEAPDGNHLRDNPLVEYARTHENLIILPHLGGATAEATERTQIYIAQRLRDWLRANP